ncbi:hypothetical protein D3C86_1915960 [compost metagenome]
MPEEEALELTTGKGFFEAGQGVVEGQGDGGILRLARLVDEEGPARDVRGVAAQTLAPAPHRFEGRGDKGNGRVGGDAQWGAFIGKKAILELSP